MFIKKTQKEIQALSPEEADAYFVEKEVNESQLLTKAIADAIEPINTKLVKAEKDLTSAGVLITELKTKTTEKLVRKIEDDLNDNITVLKSIISGRQGELEVKALSNRASVTGNTNAYVLPTIGQLGVKLRALYDVLPKIQLSTTANDNGVIKYHDWDEATTVRASASVAEGAVFPESTAKFVEYTIPIRKIGDTLPVTEEFGEDVALAAAELERFVSINVETQIDAQLINGSGTSEQLSGLLLQAPDYTPLASAIADANIYDLCRKMRTTIVKNRGSKYSPDIVVANSDTIDRYMLKKDANNNYMFRLELGNNIGALTIVEDNNMPDNQLIVGDRRFATIYEKGGVVLSEGMINAQFISDSKTIKARKRMAMLIRNVDKTGFLHCTNITTALATLAS